MAEVASHDLGVAAQRERLRAHAVEALPGGRIGLLQARLMQCRHVLGVHVVDGLDATVGQQAGPVRAERVDDRRVEVAGGADRYPARAADVSGVHDAGAHPVLFP